MWRKRWVVLLSTLCLVGGGSLLWLRSIQDVKSEREFAHLLADAKKLSIDYLHFTGALVYPDNVAHPYVGLGLGLSRFSAYETETKASMSLALGLQPKLSDNLALMAEVRGYGTFFNGSSQFICNPAICAGHIQSDLIAQLQVNVGMTFRF